MATFKKEYPCVVERVITECDIYTTGGRKFHSERAMWDTGSDTTVLSARIVKELGLKPHMQGGIEGIGGATGSNVYMVHLALPTGNMVTYIEAMESDFDDIDVLIGMDVISFGDFVLTNADNKTIFQFRLPSVGGLELIENK